jgi:hypothetical protein
VNHLHNRKHIAVSKTNHESEAAEVDEMGGACRHPLDFVRGALASG